jgi:hypothetical protein
MAVPQVTGIYPHGGPEGGETSVVITGTNLDHVTGVYFGREQAYFKPDAALPDARLTATSPRQTGASVVHVTVTTAAGPSAQTPDDQFTYVPVPTIGNIDPPGGPAAGGTTVEITGAHLDLVTGVYFGTEPAFFRPDADAPDTLLTAKSPPGRGTVQVVLKARTGATTVTSAAGTVTRFAYSGGARWPPSWWRRPRAR